MPTPSSGAISLLDIANCSLGSSYTGYVTSNITTVNYNRGGTYIPNIFQGSNQNVPTTTSGPPGTNVYQTAWYNVWGYKRISFTMTKGSGSYSVGKTAYTQNGFSAAPGTAVTSNAYNTCSAGYGSTSASSFVVIGGTYTMTGMYNDTQTGNYWSFCLNCSTAPPDADNSFTGVYDSLHGLFARSSRVQSTTSSYTTRWQFSSSLLFTSYANGTVFTCYINYYG